MDVNYVRARAIECPVCLAPSGGLCRYTGGEVLGEEMSLLHHSRWLAVTSGPGA